MRPSHALVLRVIDAGAGGRGIDAADTVQLASVFWEMIGGKSAEDALDLGHAWRVAFRIYLRERFPAAGQPSAAELHRRLTRYRAQHFERDRAAGVRPTAEREALFQAIMSFRDQRVPGLRSIQRRLSESDAQGHGDVASSASTFSEMAAKGAIE